VHTSHATGSGLNGRASSGGSFASGDRAPASLRQGSVGVGSASSGGRAGQGASRSPPPRPVVVVVAAAPVDSLQAMCSAVPGSKQPHHRKKKHKP
jgi:hypothetical protein